MKIYRNSQASLHRVRRRIAIKNLFIFKIKELNKKQTYREKPGTPLAISISTASPMQADGSGLQSRRCPSPPLVSASCMPPAATTVTRESGNAGSRFDSSAW
ncbi:hypothetical protein CLJ1_4954 [Pseudomonas paraeruginosa]|nr:hypothetical protein CLJ1_4954 [Pseudomonas aeruginosa]